MSQRQENQEFQSSSTTLASLRQAWVTWGSSFEWKFKEWILHSYTISVSVTWFARRLLLLCSKPHFLRIKPFRRAKVLTQLKIFLWVYLKWNMVFPCPPQVHDRQTVLVSFRGVLPDGGCLQSLQRNTGCYRLSRSLFRCQWRADDVPVIGIPLSFLSWLMILK